MKNICVKLKKWVHIKNKLLNIYYSNSRLYRNLLLLKAIWLKRKKKNLELLRKMLLSMYYMAELRIKILELLRMKGIGKRIWL
jgi:hypothetical protein